MSVLDYLEGALFTFRVIKNLTTNPENAWVNSYEFRATDDGTTAALIGCATALVSFEAALHAETVAFDRVVVSTWAEDSIPYDPEAFLSIPLTQHGTKPITSTELEPLGMAWRVNRQASSGRFGNLFYRGCLFENDVISTAGLPVLSSPGDLVDILDDALTSSTFEDFIGDVTPGGLQLSLINATGSQVRAIISLVSSGVSMIKQDHMWFNRTVGPSLALRNRKSN